MVCESFSFSCNTICYNQNIANLLSKNIRLTCLYSKKKITRQIQKNYIVDNFIPHIFLTLKPKLL